MKGHRIDVDSFWLPHAGSTIAKDVDFGWNAVLGVSTVFFVLVVGAMLYFVWRFRRRGSAVAESEVDHNTTLEVVWTAIPIVIVLSLFGIGFKGFMRAAVPPAGALEIMVTAQKWSWAFTYPTGDTSPGELRVPKGKPVKLVMSSRDVVHSLFIPEFRIKQDVVPGTYTTLWFEATEAGETMLLCTQYCGTGHSDMLARVVVMEPAAFQSWLDGLGGDSKLPPEKAGEALYTKLGCLACHSLDGSPRVGPTFKGIFGRSQTMNDGAIVKADEAYLKESIVAPTSKIVKGFQPVMPVFKGVVTDKQIDQLVSYLKTVK